MFSNTNDIISVLAVMPSVQQPQMPGSTAIQPHWGGYPNVHPGMRFPVSPPLIPLPHQLHCAIPVSSLYLLLTVYSLLQILLNNGYPGINVWITQHEVLI